MLGVGKNASPEEIKKAYKKLAKQYHPDLNPDSKTAEENFKEVTEAYTVLSDDNSRARYDQFGHEDPNSFGGGGFGGFGGFGGGFGGSGGFGDIFETFFGGFGGAGQQRDPNAPQRGSDLRMDIQISFEEAAKGVEKEVTVSRLESCTDCGGSGAASSSGKSTCSRCSGSGRIRINQNTAFGQFQTVKTCGECDGKGFIINDPCNKCGGSGRVHTQHKLKVNIPAGVDTGSRLRMQGEGEGGLNGGGSGDLFIYISVTPHKLFRRDGDNIHIEQTISFAEAALGAEVEVPTLDGNVKLTIPEGTQTGTTFRMRGRGVAKLRGYGRGDQYVKVKVFTPLLLTDEQKRLLKEFDTTYVETDSESGEEKKGFFGKIFNKHDDD